MINIFVRTTQFRNHFVSSVHSCFISLIWAFLVFICQLLLLHLRFLFVDTTLCFCLVDVQFFRYFFKFRFSFCDPQLLFTHKILELVGDRRLINHVLIILHKGIAAHFLVSNFERCHWLLHCAILLVLTTDMSGVRSLCYVSEFHLMFSHHLGFWFKWGHLLIIIKHRRAFFVLPWCLWLQLEPSLLILFRLDRCNCGYGSLKWTRK